MSFMKPVIHDLDNDILESMFNDGNAMGSLKGFSKASKEQGYKYAWRLSAPGYMDCTYWSPAKDVIDAVVQMLSIHGDEFDLSDFKVVGSFMDGFDDFLKGYLLGLAFTASDSEGEPLFSHPGKDITDCIDPITEVFDKLSDDDKVTVMYNCAHFLAQANSMLGGNASAAGSDFHLTRNGHGAGFWDGDWPVHGKQLTALSNTFDSCELYSENGRLGIE